MKIWINLDLVKVDLENLIKILIKISGVIFLL